MFALSFDNQGRVLYVGQLGPSGAKPASRPLVTPPAGALLVGVICALLLRRLLSRELQPIVDMSRAVARFDPINPLDQLAEPQRAELMPMHAAITVLGTRVARHIANERAFAAHAAHALRTPLAGMVTQLAAAQQRGNAEVQPFLARTREAATRLRQVVAALLTLFRSGTEVEPRPIDLQHLVNHLSIGGLRLQIDASAGLMADADLLAAALMNMLDNATRHGAQAVSISSLPLAAGQGIRIADDGPGIDAAHRQRLQAALDAQQYEGHMGLGLMLADLVCRAHGGRLVLCETERGFAADLWLSPRR